MSKPVNPLIITHAAAELAALPEAGSAGSWNRLVPAGTFKARDGRGPFMAGGKAEMQAIVDRTIKYAGSTDLMIDYDHQSVLSAVKGVGGRAPAAGWVKQLEVREDGIWGLIEWTRPAALAIKRGEYRYLSPTFGNDKAGNIQTLFNAALLNMPAMDLVAVAAGLDPSNPMENDVKNIAKALGLEETASETAILAAINALAAERARVVTTAGVKPDATSDELVTALAAKIGGGKPDPAQFVPVEQVTALQTALTTLQADIMDGKAATAVDDAIAKGKLLPSLRDWGLTLFKADAGQFSAFVDKAPSLTVTQLGNKRVTAGSEDGLSEADELAITMMGLDRAEFIKTRNAERVA